MNVAATLSRAIAGSLNTDALQTAIVAELQNRYTPEELVKQLHRAAEVLGIQSPIEEGIKVEITPQELDALRTARDVLARL